MLANPRHRIGVALSAALVALPFLAQARALWPFTADDSYITLRYARNLAAGLGPVFQTGLPRAEGCTTFLWMVLLAIPHRLGLDALLTAKLLGVTATVATLVLAARLAFRAAEARVADVDEPAARGAAPITRNRGLIERDAGLAAFVTAFGLACFPPMAVHAVSAMETALFTLLMLWTVSEASGLIASAGERPPLRFALAMLLLGLTRPEGNLVAVTCALTVLVMLPRAARGRFAHALLWGYLLPGMVYFTWRWTYYGQPLPLPFYVKVASPTALPGTSRVLGFVAALALPAGVCAMLGLVRLPRLLRPALVAATTLLLFGLFPNHLMGYQLRYLVPAAPLLFVIAGLGAARLSAAFTRQLPARHASAWLAAAGVATLLAASALSDAPRVVADRTLYARGLRTAHVALGEWLATLDHGTLAIEDAGAVPYLSGWRTLDLGGLNDVHIARTGDHSAAYVLGARPDLVVLVSRERDRFDPPARVAWENPLAEGCAEHGMRRVAAIAFHPGYWLWVLASPEGQYAHAFERFDAEAALRAERQAGGEATPAARGTGL